MRDVEGRAMKVNQPGEEKEVKLVKKKPELASEILIQRKRVCVCVCVCVSPRLCTRKWVICQVSQPLETCISLLLLGACSVWCIVQKSTQRATSVGNCHTRRSFTAVTWTLVMPYAGFDPFQGYGVKMHTKNPGFSYPSSHH